MASDVDRSSSMQLSEVLYVGHDCIFGIFPGCVESTVNFAVVAFGI